MNNKSNNEFEVAGFNVDLRPPASDTLDDGFNEHGVRENYDGDELESIDVIFDAMEPGVWKGVEVTPEFLDYIATTTDGGVPTQYDHSHSQRANVGNVTDIKFDDKLKLMVNIPDTGNSLRSDTIADFTHSTGPQITDGSIGLDPSTLEFEEPEADDAMARFVEADMIEFSLTPFPAGYENGGVTSSFSKAVDNFVESKEESQLVTYESQMR